MAMLKTRSRVDLVQVLRCWLEDRPYAVEMSHVVGIYPSDVARRVGTSASIELPDGKVPVRALSLAIGAGAPSSDRSQLLVVRSTSGVMGLLVDQVSRITSVEPERLHPVPPIARSAKTHWLKQIVRGDLNRDRLVTEDDPDDDDTLTFVLNPAALGGNAAQAPTPTGANADWLASLVPMGGMKAARQILTCSIGSPSDHGLLFGFALAQVMEVLDPPIPLPIAGGPDYLYGLFAWKKHPIPLIDLGAFLGMNRFALGQPCRVLVVRPTGASEPVAFPVHPDVRVHRLPVPAEPIKDDLRGLLPFSPSLSRGVFKFENQTLSVLDLPSVLRPR